jgi:hypothetical protein
MVFAPWRTSKTGKVNSSQETGPPSGGFAELATRIAEHLRVKIAVLDDEIYCRSTEFPRFAV